MERIKLNIQKFASNNVEIEFKVAKEQAESALKQIRSSVNTTSDSVLKFTNNVIKLGKAFNSWISSDLTRQIKGLGNTLYRDFLTKAIDTSEELNLFNVVFNNIERNGKTTFSELGKQATKFQNQLNEAFGTNKKETMRYQGLFQAMGESAGLDDKTAELMSRNMTKLSYDLASLYNTTETRAAESLRAGVYAG